MNTNFFETFVNSVNEVKTTKKVERFMIFTEPKDFKQIRLLPFNREAGFRQDLADNMNEFGFAVAVTLIYTDLFSEGDEKGQYFLYSADGQHRIFTAMRLGIPVLATVSQHNFTSKPEVVRFVASLNSTQKEWPVQQYVRTYNSLSLPAYQMLLDVQKACSFSLTTVALMLYGFRSKGAVASAIKSGDFVCNYLKETMYTLDVANKLNFAIKQVDRKSKPMTNRMVLGLHSVTDKENFNLEKFTAMYVQEYQRVKELKLDDYSDTFASWL